MLELEIEAKELYDEVKEEFVTIKPATVRLEHSLVSVSKWEARWKKPFLKPDYQFTNEEFVDYMKCMTISQNVPEEVYRWMNHSERKIVNEYINDNKTATTFSNLDGSRPNRQIVTSELIYYWMTVYQIPFECQKWHLSRLLTLIQICNIKNSNSKKMTPRSILNQNRKLNAQRRKASGSKG